MKTSVFFSILVIALALVSVGCKKATPEVTALGKLEGLSFGSSSMTITSWQISNAVGNCPADVTRIEISFDGTNWTDLQTFDPSSTISCSSDGHFTFNLDFDRTDMVTHRSSMTSGNKVTVWGRGFSDFAMTEDTKLLLGRGNSNTAGSHLYVGTGKHTSGGFVLSGRISYAGGSDSGSGVHSSGSLKLKGMIRSQ